MCGRWLLRSRFGEGMLLVEALGLCGLGRDMVPVVNGTVSAGMASPFLLR